MARLYGTITSDKSRASWCSHNEITSTVETWKATVRVELLSNGRCTVLLTDKDSVHGQTLWEGDIPV